MNPAVSHSGGYTTAAFRQVLIVDLLLYLALFWRDYSDPAQMLIAHYLSFVAITDLAVLCLPMRSRVWFNLFRLSSGVAFLVLVLALQAKGLDGESLALTALRAGLCGLRIAHALTQLRRWGPTFAQLGAFPERCTRYYRDGTVSQRIGCGYLLVGLGLLYFPHLAYWTHFNGGEARLDDILTGLQAQAGLNFCIKLFVFEILVSGHAARLAMRTLVAVLFVAQWPLMPGMFFSAPLPVAHAIVEVYEVILVALAWREWRRWQGSAPPRTA